MQDSTQAVDLLLKVIHLSTVKLKLFHSVNLSHTLTFLFISNSCMLAYSCSMWQHKEKLINLSDFMVRLLWLIWSFSPQKVVLTQLSLTFFLFCLASMFSLIIDFVFWESCFCLRAKWNLWYLYSTFLLSGALNALFTGALIHPIIQHFYLCLSAF